MKGLLPAASIDSEVFYQVAKKYNLGTDMDSMNQIVNLVNQGMSPDDAGKTLSQKIEKQLKGLLGQFSKTRPLDSGEDSFFKANPQTAGMATDDNYVILNPYSNLSPQQLSGVQANEAARLYMREFGTPNVSLTNEQQSNLAGTNYKDADEEARKATILARILSQDSSGGIPTLEQQEAIKPMLFLRGLMQY
jgi:hypothetical protein